MDRRFMLFTSNHRLVGSDDFFFQLTCHMVHIDNGPLWTDGAPDVFGIHVHGLRVVIYPDMDIDILPPRHSTLCTATRWNDAVNQIRPVLANVVAFTVVTHGHDVDLVTSITKDLDDFLKRFWISGDGTVEV